jgi:hypothetical protein
MKKKKFRVWVAGVPSHQHVVTAMTEANAVVIWAERVGLKLDRRTDGNHSVNNCPVYVEVM